MEINRGKGFSETLPGFVSRLAVVVYSFLLAFIPQFSDAQNYRSSASNGAASGVNTLTVAKPSGTSGGDVLVASVAVQPYTASITPPAGWTLIRQTNQTTGNTNAQALYYKIAGASEPASYSWTFSSSTGSAGGIMSFYNVNTTNPISTSNGTSTSSSLNHTAPTTYVSVSNTMIVTAHSFASSANWSSPVGMTEAVDRASNSVPSSGGISLQMNFANQSAAGWTGSKTATASANADVGVAQIVALVGLGCAAPSPPTVTSPVNLCLNGTASQLTATGSNLSWGNGGTITGSVSGNYGSIVGVWVDDYWSNRKLNFTTHAPNVTLTSVDYYLPPWNGVSGLRLALYNSSGTVIALSSTITTFSAGGSIATITNAFNYTLTSAGNYSVGIFAGTGVVYGDVPTSYPITETSGTISVTGHTTFNSNIYRCFDNFQFTANSGSAAPTPSTSSTGTTNYVVTQTVGGCVSAPATISVIVNPLPSASATSTQTCVGGSTGTITASGSGGAVSIHL